MKEPKSPFWENSFLSRRENHRIKRQNQRSRPERKEIAEFTRESYRKENEDFTGLGVFYLIFGILVGITTASAFILGGLAIILILFVEVAVFYVFAYPILKSLNQITTFYISDQSLFVEEIAFKRVNTKRWSLELIVKIIVARTANNYYTINVIIKNVRGVNPGLHISHTVISLPQTPKNLEYCIEFVELFREFNLPVDSTEIPLMGADGQRIPKTKNLKRSRRHAAAVRSLDRNNPREIKCQACDNLNISNSSFCMNCGTDLQTITHLSE